VIAPLVREFCLKKGIPYVHFPGIAGKGKKIHAYIPYCTLLHIFIQHMSMSMSMSMPMPMSMIMISYIALMV
jgi:hypothetical protein